VTNIKKYYNSSILSYRKCETCGREYSNS